MLVRESNSFLHMLLKDLMREKLAFAKFAYSKARSNSTDSKDPTDSTASWFITNNNIYLLEIFFNPYSKWSDYNDLLDYSTLDIYQPKFHLAIARLSRYWFNETLFIALLIWLYGEDDKDSYEKSFQF